MTQYKPSPGLEGPWQPASAAAPENPFRDARVPSVAAVIQTIGGDTTLTPPRRAALASALRTTARLLGQDPRAMPAILASTAIAWPA
jgi:hypothetical protein